MIIELPRPIVVSSNFVLLDGFTILTCGREQGMHNIPVVILENVEVIWKTTKIRDLSLGTLIFLQAKFGFKNSNTFLPSILFIICIA